MKRWMLMFAMSVLVTGLVFSAGQTEAAAGSAAPPTITIFTGSPGDMPAKENDVILKELQDALDIEIDRTTVSSDYEQQLNIRIAGGNTPDLFTVGGRNQLVNVVDQDVALALDDQVKMMPNIVKWYTETDFDKGRVAGTIYALPKRPYARYSTFLIRQDWLEELNLDMPSTLEEFAAVAEAFTTGDPDGNGKNDTFGLTGYSGVSSFRPIFGAFGTTYDGNWMVRDGEVVYSTVDPRYKEAIAWIRDMVASGVVDPELMANKSQADLNKSFNGQVGINYRNLWEYYKPEYEKRIKDVNPNADWAQMPAISGPYGKADREWDVAVTPSYNVLSADLEDKPSELDAVLRLLDYITDGVGQRLVLYGLEGVHHNFDGNAITVDPEKIKEVTYAHNWQFTGRNELLYLSTKYAWSLGYLEFVQAQPVISVYNGLVGLPEDVNFADKDRYEDEEIAKFIYGIRSMDEWDDFVKVLYDTFDLQLYIDQAESDLAAGGYVK